MKHTSPEGEKLGIKPAIYHSVEYKTKTQLAGRRVMILGTGETGMDIAYDAVKAGAKEVVLCTRGGCVVSHFLCTTFPISWRRAGLSPFPNSCSVIQ